MKLKYLLCLPIFFTILSVSDAQYSLQEAINDSKINSALNEVNNLSEKIGSMKTENLSKSYYPKIGISGQATYQSIVTELPIELPGIEIGGLSKDQYKLQGEIRQLIYDGGMSQKMKDLVNISTSLEKEKNEFEFENIRAGVLKSYFTILEIDAQSEILKLKKETLESNISVVESGIKNGILLKSELYEIQAAVISVSQEQNKLNSYRNSALKSLALLTGKDFDQGIVLEQPENLQKNTFEIGNKSAFKQLELQKEILHKNQELLETQSIPKASLFINGGYGRPALNFLSNTFEPYFLGGVQVSWSLNNLYTKSKEREIVLLNHELIDQRKELIIDGINQQKIQFTDEIKLLDELIQSDKQILELRTKIRSTAEEQLKNGTLTSSKLIPYINEENEVQEKIALRKLQLIKNQYLLEHLTGNYSK